LPLPLLLLQVCHQPSFRHLCLKVWRSVFLSRGAMETQNETTKMIVGYTNCATVSFLMVCLLFVVYCNIFIFLGTENERVIVKLFQKSDIDI
jgi:hypothetical protein